VIQSIGSNNRVIFVPDKYLGKYASTGMDDKRIILWDGYCPVHLKILPEDILKLKEEYPEAEVLVHPECRPDVIALADKVLSTSGMCDYPARSKTESFIVATEVGIIHRLNRLYPQRSFLQASERAICPNMKLNSLEKVLWCLEQMRHEVKVSESIRERALESVNRMLEIGRQE
jgi:quinolinate synthase